MKVGKPYLSTLIVLLLFYMLGACSHDEPEGYDWVNGMAFVNVNITSTSPSDTRAAVVDSFVCGTQDEQAVKSARFLFYDSNGVFVGEASVWNGGTAATGTNQNVEYWGKSTLMLTGLSSKDFPAYLVTILNAPSNFYVASTLDKLRQELATSYLTDDGYFVMTTSSFDRGDSSNPYYFATPIASTDFMKTAAEATSDAHAVPVYVERLAAKVQVTLDINETVNPRIHAGTVDNLYQIADFTFIGLSEMTTTGYIRILGWGLNCTNTESYFFKNIDTTWDYNTLGFYYNSTMNSRSYWAKSPNYGNTGCYYPPYYIPSDSKASVLSYVPSTALNHGFTADNNNVAYCCENTNTAAIIGANYPSSLTSVTVLAQLYLADGQPINDVLVRYHGMFFTQDAFVDYVIGSLRALGKGYMQYQHDGHDLELGHFKLVSVETPDRRGLKYNGRVKVQLADNKLTGWTHIKTGDTVSYEQINKELAYFVDMEEYDATGYKEGLMYYNIPLEHFNTTADVTSGTSVTVAEAHYGVVRNHFYQVSLTGITGLGVGIFVDSEPIVPQLTSSSYYHVGARVNILSWKTLSQLVVI